MDIKRVIEAADDALLRSQLAAFLAAFTQPAFGALPKREVELKVLELLRGIGGVDEKASIYSLMTDLRITRAKATQMLFDLEVRAHGGDAAKLDAEISEALRRTKFAKDGDYFVIEIESPLVLAHLRQRIRAAGHVSDTSFNSSIVRAPLDAVVDLMLNLIPRDQHEGIKSSLEQAGAPPSTIKAMLKVSLKELGKKMCHGTADHFVDAMAKKWIDPLLDGAFDLITDRWKAVLPQK